MNKRGKITELDLFLPTYKTTKLITESTEVFPKCYKDTLANQLITKMLYCVELLVRHNYGEETSQEFKETICYVSLVLRLCVDLKIISTGRFSDITLNINAIKKLLHDQEDTVSLK